MKRRSQNEWRELIALQATSGVSAQQFCQEHALNAKYFSLRKQQLSVSETALPFVRAVRETPTFPPAMQSALVIHQGKGSLHFAMLPEPEWLARLLSAAS